MCNVFVDIETLPSLSPGARDLVRKNVKPPATHKKPETIAKWWEEDGPQAIEDAYRKQSFDGAEGELCAVGFASDSTEPVSLVRSLDEPERDFLIRALAGIGQLIDTGSAIGADGRNWPVEPYFIAHNAPFDLGFMMRRCWVHGINPPFKFPRPSAREGKDYGDTMTLWAGYRGTISLDKLCRALGVQSPKDGGMDGSKVFDLWQAGDHEALAKYNRDDISALRLAWYRLNFIGA